MPMTVDPETGLPRYEPYVPDEPPIDLPAQPLPPGAQIEQTKEHLLHLADTAEMSDEDSEVLRNAAVVLGRLLDH